jgi:hypothetical protein
MTCANCGQMTLPGFPERVCDCGCRVKAPRKYRPGDVIPQDEVRFVDDGSIETQFVRSKVLGFGAYGITLK